MPDSDPEAKTAPWLVLVVFVEGAFAREDGAPRAANPYLVGTQAHAAWSAGWDDDSFAAAVPARARG